MPGQGFGFGYHIGSTQKQWSPLDLGSDLRLWLRPDSLDNPNRMLNTGDMTVSPWNTNALDLTGGFPDPLGGNTAFKLQNQESGASDQMLLRMDDGTGGTNLSFTKSVSLTSWAPISQTRTVDAAATYSRGLIYPASNPADYVAQTATGFQQGADDTFSVWAYAPEPLADPAWIYAWHPQLESGTAATAYKENGATAGGIIDQWDDSSGNDNHATQGTQASMPLVVAEALDGKSGALFDEVDDLLTVAGLVAQGQPTEHWFVAVLPATIPASGVLVDSTVAPVYCRVTPTAGGRSELYAGSTIASTTSLSTSTPYVLGFYLNGGSSSIYVNSGTPEGTGDAGAGIWNAYQIGNLGGLQIIEHIMLSSASSAQNKTNLLVYFASGYPSLGI